MRFSKFLVLFALVTAGCQSEAPLLRSVVRDNVDLSFDKLDGPQGGTIISLAATKEGVLFASVEYHGVYRSTDGGDSWSAAGFQMQNVWPLYTTPGGGVLAMTDAGLLGENTVYRSDNAGGTWVRIPDSLTSYFATTVIRVSGETMYTEGKGGLHLSTDDGYTWETLMDGPSENAFGGQYHLEILPDSVMFRMHYHGLYQSKDGGRSWEQRLTGYDCFSQLEKDSFGGVLVGARDTSIHSGMNGPRRLLRVSVDGMVTEILSDRMWRGEHRSILLQNGTMVGGSGDMSQGVYRSEDGGRSWQSTELRRGVITGFVQTSDGTVFAAAYGGIFRSHDDGRSWEECCTGLPSLPVLHLFKSTQERIFAGTRNGGLYSAKDPSDRWGAPQYGMCSVYRGFASGSKILIGTQPVFAENVYDEIRGRAFLDFVGDQLSLVVSDGAGHNWEEITPGNRGPWRIAAGRGEAVCSNAADLNMSTDGGESWQLEPMLSNASGFCIGTRGLFVVQSDTLHFRKQGGETWRILLTAPRMWQVENTDSVLVVFARDELFRSTDLGETWESVSIDKGWYAMHELSEVLPNMLSITGWRDRCLVSSDTGRSWTQFVPGSSPRAHVLSVLLDRDNHLLLGTREGLYRSRSPLNAMPSPIEFALGTPYQDSTDTDVLNIPYSLQRSSYVRLTVQDETGMDIRTCVEEHRDVGGHLVRLNNLPAPGDYTLLLNVDGRVQRRPLLWRLPTAQ